MDRYFRTPKKARVFSGGGTAHWYADPTRIELFVDGKLIVISRRQLEAYIRHTEKKS